MEQVKNEHERIQRRLKTSQSIKRVQKTIDLLQSARDSIASGWCLLDPSSYQGGTEQY